MRTKSEILEAAKNAETLNQMNVIGMEVQCDIRDALVGIRKELENQHPGRGWFGPR